MSAQVERRPQRISGLAEQSIINLYRLMTSYDKLSRFPKIVLTARIIARADRHKQQEEAKKLTRASAYKTLLSAKF